MAIKISNAFITKLQMVSDGSFNILEDFNGTAGIISGSAEGGLGGGIYVCGTYLPAVLHYDPSNVSSYSGTGTTLYNIGTDGNTSGTTGTLSGVSLTTDATAGDVFDFDGGSDRITFSSYDFGNKLTVGAWVYPRTESSINTILANAGAGLNQNGFKLEWNNWQTTDLKMVIEAGNGSSGNTYTSTNSVVVEDEWQFLTYVLDFENQTASLYRNGSEVASSGTLVTNINTSAAWNIGSMMGSYYMNANLGEVKVFKQSLCATDVLAEYNATKTRYGL